MLSGHGSTSYYNITYQYRYKDIKNIVDNYQSIENIFILGRLQEIPEQKIIELAHRSLESVMNDKMNVKDSSVFRWKYAQCGRSTQDQMFTKIKHNIFAIGDWHISSRVESAFLSGKALAEFLSNKRP